MKIGQIVTVDEIGTPEPKTCEYGCDHRVYAVTRRNLVIFRKRQEPNPHDMSKWAGDPNWKPPLADVFTAVDAEGTEWEYLAGDGGGEWEAGDRVAKQSNPVNGAVFWYVGGKSRDGFTFTDTTQDPTTGVSDASD